MRLHLRDGSGLHGIITNGGQAVNIIPEITECQFLARGVRPAATRRRSASVARCAEAAALATGTKADCPDGWRLQEHDQQHEHRGSLRRSEALGARSPIAPLDIPTGSTDMGDISHAIPAIHPNLRNFEPRRRRLS